MTKEINLLDALHPARRARELGLFNRVVENDALDRKKPARVTSAQVRDQQER
jgi:enoyl-CoA hydratase